MDQQRWISVRIEEHTTTGTRVIEGVFPQSVVTYQHHESLSAILTQLMETMQCVRSGNVVEFELSYTEPMTIELNSHERNLCKRAGNKTGSHRFMHSFITPNRKVSEHNA